MMKTLRFIFLALIVGSAFVACDKDDDKCGSTYAKDAKSIIDRSCAYAGCHAGADAGMFVSAISKDYTNYAGMKQTLDNGSFVTRTLDSLNMPPPFFTPADRPQELTQEEIDILQCWADDGFPES